MASPVFQVFCCEKATKFADVNAVLGGLQYHSACITLALFSTCGTITFLLRKRRLETTRGINEVDVAKSLGLVLRCIHVCDILACVGITGRSIIWFAGNYFSDVLVINQINSGLVIGLCIFVSIWIHYFVTASSLWVLFYAAETRSFIREQQGKLSTKHILGWLLPAVILSSGAGWMYFPKLDRCEELAKCLPNITMLFLLPVSSMLIIPVLYHQTANSVQQILMSTGSYTPKEQDVLRAIKARFISIVATFYIRWIPDITCTILIFSNLTTTVPNLILSIWHFTAAVASLQPLLTAIAYRGWGTSMASSRLPVHIQPSRNSDSSATTEMSPFFRPQTGYNSTVTKRPM